IRENLKDSGLF
nr:Chain A, Guanine nucleotide-binding protein G(T), alpha-1 subunit [Bos taurus]